MRNFILISFLLIGFAFAGSSDSSTPTGGDLSKDQNLSVLLISSYSNDSHVEIVIIESKSSNSGHVMDSKWLAVADSLNMTSGLYKQSMLDSLDQLSVESLLIVSSGLIDIPADRINNMIDFIMRGGNIYLQGEYLPNYTTNLGFKSIVDSLGGSIGPCATVSGTLTPMRVLPPLNSNFAIVDSLNHFWFGCTSTGDETLIPFLEFNQQYFGFIFTPPNTKYGTIITTTDQDWVRVGASAELMKNILAYLLNITTSIESPLIGGTNIPSEYYLSQNFPNPFNPTTTISWGLENTGNVNIIIYNILGEKVASYNFENQTAGQHSVVWNGKNYKNEHVGSGSYFYQIISKEFSTVKKMLLLR